MKPLNVNERFNKELAWQIEGRLPKGHIYQLGMPSEALLASGVDNLPIELSADRLFAKAQKEYRNQHDFKLTEIENLATFLANPIAVFDSTKQDESKVLLLELRHNEYNFIAVMRIHKSDKNRKINVEVNDIRSIYPKDRIEGVLDWVNSKNNLLKWVDKTKALDFFSTQSTNLIGGGEKNKDFPEAKLQEKIKIAKKIVQNFNNPKFTQKQQQIKLKL